MALSLNQIKKRSQQLSSKQESKVTTPIKKKPLAPWEDVVAQTSAPEIQASVVIAEEPKQLISLESAKVQDVSPVTHQIEELVAEPLLQVESVVAHATTEVETPKLETKVETGASDEVQVTFATVEKTIITKAKPIKFTETAAVLSQPDVKSVSEIKPKKHPSAEPIKLQRPSSIESLDEIPIGFAQITGIQRKIVLYVFRDCLNRASLESSPLTVEHLSKSIEVAYHSIKKSIDRLQTKSVLERIQFKNGRGGWTQYRIARPIYLELGRLHKDGLLPEISSADVVINPTVKLETNWRQEVGLNRSSQAEAIGTQNFTELSYEWLAIDFEPLVGFGFTKHHLKQIAGQGKFTPAEVQDFIHFFSFDMVRNNKAKDIKGEPLNYFMGIIRKGMPYVPPKNYVSPEEETRKQYLAYLEKRLNDRLEEEKKIKELEFHNWKATADLAEILKSAPEYVRGKTGPIMDIYLDGHFTEHVWPKILGKFSANSEERVRIADEIRHSLENA